MRDKLRNLHSSVADISVQIIQAKKQTLKQADCNCNFINII